MNQFSAIQRQKYRSFMLSMTSALLQFVTARYNPLPADGNVMGGLLAVSVSDISRILERVPVWRQLVTLPRRVSQLESRLAEMEGKRRPVAAQPSKYRCDACFTPMKIVAEEKLDRLDVFGQVVHTLECFDCGRVTSKMFTPDEGYM